MLCLSLQGAKGDDGEKGEKGETGFDGGPGRKVCSCQPLHVISIHVHEVVSMWIDCRVIEVTWGQKVVKDLKDLKE